MSPASKRHAWLLALVGFLADALEPARELAARGSERDRLHLATLEAIERWARAEAEALLAVIDAAVEDMP